MGMLLPSLSIMDRAELLALYLLLLVASLLAVLALSDVLRRPYAPLEWLTFYASILLTKTLWRASVDRPLPIAPGQGAVIVSNHRSSVDPFFVQLAVGSRRVHWMVASEYVEHPAFRWFLRMAQVIPTRRGGIDTAATKQAIRCAAAGGLVGMLPEGRINMTQNLMLPVRPGAALIALRAHVPVIPCYIEGAPYDKVPYSPILMPAKVRVRVGTPVDLSEYYGRESDGQLIRQLTISIMTDVARLAGQPHFPPQLAGRNWKPTSQNLSS